MTGQLVVVAAPIGNYADASDRLRTELATADVIAAEDTRRLRRLLTGLGVETRADIVSCHEHNERDRAMELIARVAAGSRVVVITDAGMPGVSDPGYRTVEAAIAADVPVTCAPGPSAVTTALVLSGLPSDRFCFEGFPPRKEGERARFFAELADDRRTLVFFESPRRTAKTLLAMVAAFGPGRRAAVCRELTKTYEEVVRGGLAELAAWAEDTEVLGEICIVVGGAELVPAEPADVLAAVLRRVAGGERLKDAARAEAAAHGVSAKELYDAAVAHRAAASDDPES